MPYVDKEYGRLRDRELKRFQRAENHEQFIEYECKWRAANKEKVSLYNRKWNSANRGKIAKRAAKRYRNDINFRLANLLRSRLGHAVRDGRKAGSAVSDLGCTIPELKVHLETQFTEGMNWDNWALDGWHIDHIVPLSSFDLTDPEQVKTACHFMNLQPMWAKENIRKGARC